ncbi:MAG: Short chain dehydrogenase [Ramlibacter sp.]|nr:Short chain dehydrogenase [Ramlibacter sp.]
MKVAGSTVLVTGANGGIGSAIARRMARAGVTVVLVSRDAVRLVELAVDLRATGARAIALPADLTKPGVPAAVIRDAVKHAGAIDILVNCAGIQNFGFFEDEDAGDTAALFHVNTIAPMALVQAVLPHMLERNSGQIVNVGSIFGSIGFPCFASYSASKFALRGFSEALRRELAGRGVGVTYVAPRFTRTAFNGAAVVRMADALKMGQDGPDAVAESVVSAIEQGDKERYLGWPEKLFVRINALFPQLVDRPLAGQRRKMLPFAAEARR